MNILLLEAAVAATQLTIMKFQVLVADALGAIN